MNLNTIFNTFLFSPVILASIYFIRFIYHYYKKNEDWKEYFAKFTLALICIGLIQSIQFFAPSIDSAIPNDVVSRIHRSSEQSVYNLLMISQTGLTLLFFICYGTHITCFSDFFSHHLLVKKTWLLFILPGIYIIDHTVMPLLVR